MSIFCGAGPHVKKSESGEAFPMRDQHGVGNASPDVVFLDAIDDVVYTSVVGLLEHVDV